MSGTPCRCSCAGNEDISMENEEDSPGCSKTLDSRAYSPGLRKKFTNLQQHNTGVSTANPVFEVSSEQAAFNQACTAYQYEAAAESSSSKEDMEREEFSSSIEDMFEDWNWGPDDAMDQQTMARASFPISRSTYDQDLGVERPGPSRQHASSKPCFSSDSLGTDWNLTSVDPWESGSFFGKAEGPSPEAGRGRTEGQSLSAHYMGLGEPGSSTVKERVIVIVTPPSDSKLYSEDASDGSSSRIETIDDADRERLTYNAPSTLASDKPIPDKASCSSGTERYNQEGDESAVSLTGGDREDEQTSCKNSLDTLPVAEKSSCKESLETKETEVKKTVRFDRYGRSKEDATLQDQVGVQTIANQDNDSRQAKAENHTQSAKVDLFKQTSAFESHGAVKPDEQNPNRRKFDKVLSQLNEAIPFKLKDRCLSAENQNQSGLRDSRKSVWPTDSPSETLSFPFTGSMPEHASSKCMSDSSLSVSSAVEQVSTKPMNVPVPRKRSLKRSTNQNSESNTESLTQKMVALFSNLPHARPQTKTEEENAHVSRLTDNFGNKRTSFSVKESTAVDHHAIVNKKQSPGTTRKVKEQPVHLSVTVDKDSISKAGSSKTEAFSAVEEPGFGGKNTTQYKTCPQTSNIPSQSVSQVSPDLPRKVTKSADRHPTEATPSADSCPKELRVSWDPSVRDPSHSQDVADTESSKSSVAQSVEAILLVLESMQNVLTKMSAMTESQQEDSGTEGSSEVKQSQAKRPKKALQIKALRKKREETPPSGPYAYSIAQQVVGQAVRKIAELYPDCQQRVMRSLVGHREEASSLSLARTAVRQVLQEMAQGSSVEASVQTSESLSSLDAQKTCSHEAGMWEHSQNNNDQVPAKTCDNTVSTGVQTTESLTALSSKAVDAVVDTEDLLSNEMVDAAVQTSESLTTVRVQRVDAAVDTDDLFGRVMACVEVQTLETLATWGIPGLSVVAVTDTGPPGRIQLEDDNTLSSTSVGTAVDAPEPPPLMEEAAAGPQQSSAEEKLSDDFLAVVNPLTEAVGVEKSSSSTTGDISTLSSMAEAAGLQQILAEENQSEHFKAAQTSLTETVQVETSSSYTISEAAVPNSTEEAEESPQVPVEEKRSEHSQAALNTTEAVRGEMSSSNVTGDTVTPSVMEEAADSEQNPVEETRSEHFQAVLSSLTEAVREELSSSNITGDTATPDTAAASKHNAGPPVTRQQLRALTDKEVKSMAFELVHKAIELAVEALIERSELYSTDVASLRTVILGTRKVSEGVPAKGSASDSAGQDRSGHCNQTADGSDTSLTSQENEKEVAADSARDMELDRFQNEFVEKISQDVYSIVSRIFHHLSSEMETVVNVTSDARRELSSNVDDACVAASCEDTPGCSGATVPPVSVSDSTPGTSRAHRSSITGTDGGSREGSNKAGSSPRTSDSPTGNPQTKQRDKVAAGISADQKSVTLISSTDVQAPDSISSLCKGADHTGMNESTVETESGEGKKPLARSPDKHTVRVSRSYSSHGDTDSSVERLFKYQPMADSGSFGFSEHSISHRAVTESSDTSVLRNHQLDIERHWASPTYLVAHLENANSLRLVDNGGVAMHGGNHPEHVRQVDRPSCSGTFAAPDAIKTPAREQLTSKSLTTTICTKDRNLTSSTTGPAGPQPLQRLSKPSGNKTARRFHSFSEPKLDFYSRTEELSCSRPRQRLLDVPEQISSEWSIIGYYPPRAQPVYVITNNSESSTTDSDGRSNVYEVEFQARLQQNEVDVVLDIVANYQHLHSDSRPHRGRGPGAAVTTTKPHQDSDYSSGAVDDSGPRSPDSDRRSRNSSTQTTSSSHHSCTCRTVTCQDHPRYVGGGQTSCDCCPCTSRTAARPQCSCPGTAESQGGQTGGASDPCPQASPARAAANPEQSQTAAMDRQEGCTVQRAACHAVCSRETSSGSRDTARTCPVPNSLPPGDSVDPQQSSPLFQQYRCEDSHHQSQTDPARILDFRPLRTRSLDQSRSDLCDLHSLKSRAGSWTAGGWTDKDHWCEACKTRQAVSETPAELCRHMADFQAEVSRNVREIRSAMAGLCSLVRSEHEQGEETRKQLDYLARQLTPPHSRTLQSFVSQASRTDRGSSSFNLSLSSLGLEGSSYTQEDGARSWCVDDFSSAQALASLVLPSSASYCSSLPRLVASYEDCPEPSTSYKVSPGIPPQFSTWQSTRAGPSTSGKPPQSVSGREAERVMIPSIFSTTAPPPPPVIQVKKDIGRCKNRSAAPTPQKSPVDPSASVLRAPAGPNTVNLSGRDGAFYSVTPTSNRASAASGPAVVTQYDSITNCEAGGVIDSKPAGEVKELFASDSNRSATDYEQRDPFAIGDCSEQPDAGLFERHLEVLESREQFRAATKLFLNELGIMAGMAFGGLNTVSQGTQHVNNHPPSTNRAESEPVRSLRAVPTQPSADSVEEALVDDVEKNVTSDGREGNVTVVGSESTCGSKEQCRTPEQPLTEISPKACRRRSVVNYPKRSVSDLRDLFEPDTKNAQKVEVGRKQVRFDTGGDRIISDGESASHVPASKTSSNMSNLTVSSLMSVDEHDSVYNTSEETLVPSTPTPACSVSSCWLSMDDNGNYQTSSETESVKVSEFLSSTSADSADTIVERCFQSSSFQSHDDVGVCSSYQSSDVSAGEKGQGAENTDVRSDYSRVSLSSSSDASLTALSCEASFHTARDELDHRLQSIEIALDTLEDQLSEPQSRHVSQRSPTFLDRMRSVALLLQIVEDQVGACQQNVQQEEEQVEPAVAPSCLSLEQDLLQSFRKRLGVLILQQQQLSPVPEETLSPVEDQELELGQIVHASEGDIEERSLSVSSSGMRSPAGDQQRSRPVSRNSSQPQHVTESNSGCSLGVQQSFENAENGSGDSTASHTQGQVPASSTLRGLEQILLTLAEQLTAANIEQLQQDDASSYTVSQCSSDTVQLSVSGQGRHEAHGLHGRMDSSPDLISSRSMERILQGLIERLAVSQGGPQRLQDASPAGSSSVVSDSRSLDVGKDPVAGPGYIPDTQPASRDGSEMSLGSRIQQRCQELPQPAPRHLSTSRGNINTNHGDTFDMNGTTARNTDCKRAAAVARDVGVNTEITATEKEVVSCEVHHSVSDSHLVCDKRTDRGLASQPVEDQQSCRRYEQRVRSLERELLAERELHSITRTSLQSMERDHSNLRLQVASLRQKQARRDKRTRLKEILARAQVWDEKFDENG